MPKDNHKKFLSELKDLSPTERRVALKLARSSRPSARRYIRLVLENKKSYSKAGTGSMSAKEGDSRHSAKRKGDYFQANVIAEGIFGWSGEKIMKKIVGRNYAPPIRVDAAAKNLEVALGQYATSYARKATPRRVSPDEFAQEAKAGLAKGLRLCTSFARHVATSLDAKTEPAQIKRESTDIREKILRAKIRELLVKEQVVGYTAPQEKKSDGGGYLSVGDMGVDTTLGDDSTDEDQASANQVRKLTQQRQQDLDSGDTVDAENVGQQLGMARKMRG